MNTLHTQGTALFLCLAAIATAAEPTTSYCLPESSPPDIGAWFWESFDDFKPGQYKVFVDLVAEHSPFRVLTTSQRVPKEVTDPDVHDLVKAAAAYARQRGLVVAYDLDVRLARAAFHKQYPDEMQVMLKIVTFLRERGLAPSYQCKGLSGRCRLVDGTEVVVAANQEHAAGLPIHTEILIRGAAVKVDAEGIAAVRLDKDGKPEALAASGLKSFRAGLFSIDLPDRADVALRRDEAGNWHGVLQDCAGRVPQPLAAMTKDWLRLAVPPPCLP